MKYLFFLINVFIISCSTNNNVVEVSNKSNIIHKKQGEIEIIKVYPGDSLSQIALKYRVPLELLAEINNIPTLLIVKTAELSQSLTASAFTKKYIEK